MTMTMSKGLKQQEVPIIPGRCASRLPSSGVLNFVQLDGFNIFTPILFLMQ